MMTMGTMAGVAMWLASTVWVVHTQSGVPREDLAGIRAEVTSWVATSGVDAIDGSHSDATTECLSARKCAAEAFSAMRLTTTEPASPHASEPVGTAAPTSSPQPLAGQAPHPAPLLLHVHTLRVGAQLLWVCRIRNEWGGIVTEDRAAQSVAETAHNRAPPCARTHARLLALGQEHPGARARENHALIVPTDPTSQAPAAAPSHTATREPPRGTRGLWPLGATTLGALAVAGGTSFALAQNALRLDPTADGDARGQTAYWIPMGGGLAALGVGAMAWGILEAARGWGTTPGEAAP